MACRNCYKYPFCEKCESPMGTCEKPYMYQSFKHFKSKLDASDNTIPESKTSTWSSSEIGGTKIYWKRRD